MKNGLRLTHLATGIPEEIPLNGKEMQLAMDNSSKLNISWEMHCESVHSRLGIWIEGNFELDEIVVNGKVKPLH